MAAFLSNFLRSLRSISSKELVPYLPVHPFQAHMTPMAQSPLPSFVLKPVFHSCLVALIMLCPVSVMPGLEFLRPGVCMVI